MKKRILFYLLPLILIGCSSTQDLYYWGPSKKGVYAYDANLYEAYKRQTPKSLCILICTYDDIVCHPTGTTLLPPPGICAEYGYILTQQETMQVFAENATNKQKDQLSRSPYGSDPQQGAIKLFQQEMKFYPESVPFLRPFVERLTGQKIEIPALDDNTGKEANYE